MDNTDSEMIEALNILRPPVRRDYKPSRFGYHPNAVNFMSEWRKPKKRIKGGKRIRRSLESSTSLILKKTSDSQIFDRYPVVSYTNTSIQRQRQGVVPCEVKSDVKEKPLIKVIVIPNDQPSEGKPSENNNKVTRIYRSNTDNDNGIETKNVYLVVAGKKRDKIYEIKTTESATLSATELKDDPVNKVFNGDCFKQFIKLLNMEKKKPNQITDVDDEIGHICKCSGTCGSDRQPFDLNGPVHEIDTGKSKVRIYGQIGLTDDDRYVLKCSATVDDKPIQTKFSTVGQKVSDDFVRQNQTDSRHQFRVSTQTGLRYEALRTDQARNDHPQGQDDLRRSKQTPAADKDMSPMQTRESHRKYLEPPPGPDNYRRSKQTSKRDVSPHRTPESYRIIDEPPPGSDNNRRNKHLTKRDVSPQKTRESHRRPGEFPTDDDDFRLNNQPIDRDRSPTTREQQCRFDGYSPENDMAPRKTIETSHSRPLNRCPNPLECRDSRTIAYDETRASARRNTPPRKTVLEERYNSHHSQATQANIKKYANNDCSSDNYGNDNVADNAHKSRPSTKDNNTQCTCQCDNTNNPHRIKGTQSPLVIISVYPNSDADCKLASVSKNAEANIYEASPADFPEGHRRNISRQAQKHDATTLQSKGIQKNNSKSKLFIRKSRRVPSRSPTPPNMKSKKINDQNKVIETRMVKTNVRSHSPSKMPKNKNSSRSITSKTIKTQEPKKKYALKQKNITTIKTSKNSQMSKCKRKPTSKDKYLVDDEINSEPLVADQYKKAINKRVDEYNRKSPQHNVSAVSINIESENEYYDVTFHQGEFVSDLLVRKTSKKHKKSNESTTNFLPKTKNSIPAVFQKFPENDETKTETMRSSKLKARDSLEISISRHNQKRGMETQTGIGYKNSVSKDDTRFFAPIKHYTGDDCNLCDPLARDKEIQQLLGVSRRVVASQTSDVQKDMFGYTYFITQQCFSEERECKDILFSNVEFLDSLCSCCCLRRSRCQNLNKPLQRSKKKPSINKIKPASEKHQVEEPILTKVSCCPCDGSIEKIAKKTKKAQEKQKEEEKKKKAQIENLKKKSKTKIVERKEPTVERTSLYQQLILNRNIHVFLQVEKFSKQKPIILSKKQYDKVKKTIQSTLSKNKHLMGKKANKVDCECVESLISIGEVRQKTKQKGYQNDNTEMQTEGRPVAKKCSSIPSWFRSKCCKKKREEQVDTVILYSRDVQNREHFNTSNFKIASRQTMSSLEVRYASTAYIKHVSFSSVDTFEPYSYLKFGPLASESSFALKNPISIETLFKGHNKSPTPNLGTSSLSCISEPSCSSSPKLFDKPTQAKRPFLKRLMSCLVMRSDKVPMMAKLKLQKRAPSVDSSFDSYHFSTSLGAIEMSSSLYDTSASFFSNHSVYPKSNKIKRSFLNSMRGFLYNKRS